MKYLLLICLCLGVFGCKKQDVVKPANYTTYSPWGIELSVYGRPTGDTSNTFVTFTDSNYVLRDTVLNYKWRDSQGLSQNWNYSGFYQKGTVHVTVYHSDSSGIGIMISKIQYITTFHNGALYSGHDSIVLINVKNVGHGKDSLSYIVP